MFLTLFTSFLQHCQGNPPVAKNLSIIFLLGRALALPATHSKLQTPPAIFQSLLTPLSEWVAALLCQ